MTPIHVIWLLLALIGYLRAMALHHKSVAAVAVSIIAIGPLYSCDVITEVFTANK